MNLREAKAKGLKTKRATRVGRGPGSGSGKTSGRGHKGAKSRSGFSRRIGWEGGQMPLFRRVPKRGFNNKLFKRFFTIVNVEHLNSFEDGTVVDLQAILSSGLASKEKHTDLLKILGNGELKRKLTVKVDAVSQVARQKIEQAGGIVEIIPRTQHRPRFVKKGDMPAEA